MTTGWKCPVCGAGLAPHVQRCGHDGNYSMAPYYQTVPSVPYPTWQDYYTAPYPYHWPIATISSDGTGAGHISESST